MSGRVVWWQWAEHVLAVGGLAWLANTMIEALSRVMERQQAATQLDRGIQENLKRVWAQEPVVARKAEASQLVPRTPFGRNLSEAPLPASDQMERQVALARWGGVVAWQLARHADHEQVLLDLYTRASRGCMQSASGVTLSELGRITEGALRKEARPTDRHKGLLYDLAALYFESRRTHGNDLAAAAVVPMLLDEFQKTPDAGADELLARWQVRTRGQRQSYRPGEATPGSE